jgi:hypothetical protein
MTGRKKGKAVILPVDLYHRIEEKARSAGSPSTDEYVAFIIEKALKDDDRQTALCEEDEKEVKKRLKALGYLE